MSKPQKHFLGLTLTPKTARNGPKKLKMTPKYHRIKKLENKNIVQNESWSLSKPVTYSRLVATD